jgi:hypothetical protein
MYFCFFYSSIRPLLSFRIIFIHAFFLSFFLLLLACQEHGAYQEVDRIIPVFSKSHDASTVH